MTQRLQASELALALSRPARFGEYVDLQGYQIDGDLTLSNRILSGFDLSGAQCHGAITLSDVGFGGLNWLRKVRFSGDVTFKA